MNDITILKLINSGNFEDVLIGVEDLLIRSEEEIMKFFEEYGILAKEDPEERLENTDWMIVLDKAVQIPKEYELGYIRKGNLYLTVNDRFLILDLERTARYLMSQLNPYSILTSYE